MATISKKVRSRLIEGIKKFQPIMASAKARDVNESDTSVIVSDIVCALLGYDKYADLTTEHCIRNTYCDLALKVDGKIKLLVELKAIGISLKETHLKQAVDYASNHGVDWVVLSNGETWKIYKVVFEKPIKSILVEEFDFLTLNPRNNDDLARLYLVCKEAWPKSVLNKHLEEKEVLNKFTVGAILMSDEIISHVRRILRKASSGIKISDKNIYSVIKEGVIKREVLEDERTKKMLCKLQRFAKRKDKTGKKKEG